MKNLPIKKTKPLPISQIVAEFASDGHTSDEPIKHYLKSLKDSIDEFGELEKALKTTKAFLDLGADSAEQREKKIRIREWQKRLQEIREYAANEFFDDNKVDSELDLKLKTLGVFLTEIILMIVKLDNARLKAHIQQPHIGVSCNAHTFLMLEQPGKGDSGASREKTRVVTEELLSKIKKHLPKTHEMFYSSKTAVYKKPGTTFGRRLRGSEFRYPIIQVSRSDIRSSGGKYINEGIHASSKFVFEIPPELAIDQEPFAHPLTGGFKHHLEEEGDDGYHSNCTQIIIENYCADIQQEFKSEVVPTHPALERFPISDISNEWYNFLGGFSPDGEVQEGKWITWNPVVCELPA